MNENINLNIVVALWGESVFLFIPVDLSNFLKLLLLERNFGARWQDVVIPLDKGLEF